MLDVDMHDKASGAPDINNIQKSDNNVVYMYKINIVIFYFKYIVCYNKPDIEGKIC